MHCRQLSHVGLVPFRSLDGPKEKRVGAPPMTNTAGDSTWSVAKRRPAPDVGQLPRDRYAAGAVGRWCAADHRFASERTRARRAGRRAAGRWPVDTGRRVTQPRRSVEQGIDLVAGDRLEHQAVGENPLAGVHHAVSGVSGPALKPSAVLIDRRCRVVDRGAVAGDHRRRGELLYAIERQLRPLKSAGAFAGACRSTGPLLRGARLRRSTSGCQAPRG